MEGSVPHTLESLTLQQVGLAPRVSLTVGLRQVQESETFLSMLSAPSPYRDRKQLLEAEPSSDLGDLYASPGELQSECHDRKLPGILSRGDVVCTSGPRAQCLDVGRASEAVKTDVKRAVTKLAG